MNKIFVKGTAVENDWKEKSAKADNKNIEKKNYFGNKDKILFVYFEFMSQSILWKKDRTSKTFFHQS